MADSPRFATALVGWFAIAAVVWGLKACTVGAVAVFLLVQPDASAAAEGLSYGRLAPIYANLALYGFAANGIFAGIYYSTQRLCGVRLVAAPLAWLQFVVWQASLIVGTIALFQGKTQGRFLTEMPWPVDVATAGAWLALGISYFATLARRRERRTYVSLWFYSAAILGMTLVHVGGNLATPAGDWLSYPPWAGVRDAYLQAWYAQGVETFWIAAPLLGLMYHALPQIARRPLWSYRLAIVQFWGLVVFALPASGRFLSYTAAPEWVQSIGMVCGLMLAVAAWGGLLNCWRTLAGAPIEAGDRPAALCLRIALLFLGLWIAASAALSIKTVFGLVQFTDWMVGYAHLALLGFAGLAIVGTLSWALPRMLGTTLAAPRLAAAQAALAVVGVIVLVAASCAAGWRQHDIGMALDERGQVRFADIVTGIQASEPFWQIALLGIVIYSASLVVLGVNLLATWLARRVPVASEVPARLPEVHELQPPAPMAGVSELGQKLLAMAHLAWHARWESQPARMACWIVAAMLVPTMFVAWPLVSWSVNMPVVATVKPYTPLEVYGRDLYVAQGCVNCHTQMVRPLLAETRRYGPFSVPGEGAYDRPAQWGWRRVGPDLAREGGKRDPLWHVMHFANPDKVTPGSVMPSFAFLLERKLDFAAVAPRVEALARLGVPYGKDATRAAALAQAQADALAQEIMRIGGAQNYADREVIALVAYVQRLGTDLFAPPPAAPSPEGPTGE